MQAFALAPCAALTRMVEAAPPVPRVGGPAVAGQRPRWFRAPAPGGQRNSRYAQLAEDLRSLDLHTVCEEAQCPK
jgi:lipoyl synthase